MTKKSEETDAQESGDFEGLQTETDTSQNFTCPNCGFNPKEHAERVKNALPA